MKKRPTAPATGKSDDSGEPLGSPLSCLLLTLVGRLLFAQPAPTTNSCAAPQALRIADVGQRNVPFCQEKRSMTKPPMRCILFDVGETLWTRQDDATWYSFLSAANQRATTLLSTYIADRSKSELDLNAIIHDHIRSISYNSMYEPDFAHATAEALHLSGYSGIDDTVGAALFEALRIPIVGSRILFEDVLPTLHELRQRDFLLGIVTNRYHGGSAFLADLRELGLLDYIASLYIAISADLGIRKPHADIFLHALNALDVRPKEAVMVGDSLYADIYGAQQLGIFTVWKPSLRTRAAVQIASPDIIVGNDEILAYARAQGHSAHIFHTITPDVIIEHISDLLNLFL
jgi:FMN phosphatase YigB (HAD superfamily)